MARGGARTGSGRPKGVDGLAKRLDRENMAKAQEAMNASIPGAFEGDAYAFLAAIYKNPENPLPVRMKAAETAIGYERPKLAAVEHSGNADNPLQIIGHIFGAALNGTGRVPVEGPDHDAEDDVRGPELAS